MTPEELALIRQRMNVAIREQPMVRGSPEIHKWFFRNYPIDIGALLSEVERLQASQADLAMLVKRLCSGHGSVGQPTKDKAIDFLKRHDLLGSVTRDT